MKKAQPSGATSSTTEVVRLDGLDPSRSSRSLAELLRLDGKVALVTGGGGNGLGHAISHRLAEQGATLAVLDIDETAARTSARSVADRWGTRAIPVVADVSDWNSVKNGVDSVLDSLGSIDILVNNAGGSGGIAKGGQRVMTGMPFSSMSPEEIDLVTQINLQGAMYVTRAALAGMLERGTGRIVMIASEGAKIGIAGSAVYSAAKAGLIGLTRVLASELGPNGVTVVCVCPGFMVGPTQIKALSDGGPFADMIADAFSRSSIGRPSVYDEVAGAVAFFAGSAGEYAHGTAISIGGGMSD